MHSAKNKAQATERQATTPVYRQIPAAAAAAATAPGPQPGEVGRAAVAAAMTHQLHRYADEIEQYVNASNMRVLLNRIQGDLKRDDDDSAARPKLRLRRE
jgi:hypothetical protein